MKEINNYLKAINNMIAKFEQKMYELEELEEVSYDNIVELKNNFLGPINVGDFFFSLDEVYQVLKYDMPIDIVRRRTDHRLEGGRYNLYNYYLMNKYTKEELEDIRKKDLEKSKEDMDKAKELFEECLKKA